MEGLMDAVEVTPGREGTTVLMRRRLGLDNGMPPPKKTARKAAAKG
jgi:hypothetical protein